MEDVGLSWITKLGQGKGSLTVPDRYQDIWITLRFCSKKVCPQHLL